MFCYQKNFFNPTLPVDEAQFYALVRAEQWNEAIDRFRDTGDQKVKRGLPAFIFQAVFDETQSKKGIVGRWRKQAATRLTGLVVMDVDHVDAPRETWALIDKGQLTIDNELRKRILLVYITPSGHGLKIVFKARQDWGNLIDNQHQMAKLLGLEIDEACKDASRMSFICKESDILYIDRELFTYESKAYAEQFEEEYRAGKTQASKQGDEQVKPCGDEKAPTLKTFKGRPYSEIIDAWWQRNGGVPQEGERNVKLYQLAVNLRAICDNNKSLLLEVMPRLGLDEQEVRNIVDSACKEVPKGVSKTMREIIDLDSSPKQGDSEGVSCPPVIPDNLPRLIALLTSKTPGVYKAAVAHAVFPPLATHLCGVSFNYTDNVEHEATLMNCLMAPTGAGKGCIDEPIRHIMQDIKERDAENERREAEWKKDCQRKGANKDKQVRPEGLVIQMIDSDMTKPALVTRMDEAEGHFVYVKLNELDLFEQLKGQTGKQHFQLMCLAFDPGAEYGQTRVGTQSVTARPVCRFNWNACTTILKGRRFFNRVLTDGPVSRINFCTIPGTEIGADQPVYGRYDADFDEQLKPYIDNLVQAKGQIDCPQAYQLAQKLQGECAELARLSQDEVYWNLSHRACVIAWLKACVLFVANGCQWEESIEDFVRWSLQYDLWCKMAFFGADIEKENKGDAARIGTRGPRNLLELLPDKFTLDDAKRVRQQQGMGNDAHKAMKMIRTWMNRGYVIQNTEYSFQKTAYFGSSTVTLKPS